MYKEDSIDEYQIRNCTFAFRCTQTWDSLSPTNDSSVRYCKDCDRGVHLCRTDSELTDAIKQNYCVAIVTTDTEGDEEDPVNWPIGDIAMPYSTEDEDT